MVYTKKKSAICKGFAAVMCICLLALCAGCSTEPKKPMLKVAIWGGPKEIDIINSIVNKWQAEHQEIDVKLQHTPAGEYTNKLLIRMAGGTAPDVMFSEANIFVSFFAMDAFLDLSPLIEEDEDFDIDSFFPEVIDRFTRDGKTYCIPRDTAPFACVYYNKNLFDDAGIPYPDDNWDWQDMLEKAQALTKYNDNGRVEEYGFYGWAWENFVYSNGGALVDDVEHPTEFALNRPESTEGLQFYADLINKYGVCPSPNDLGNMGMGAQQLFMSGKLAMYQSGIWETLLLRDITEFDWDVAMFPKGPTGIRKFGNGGSGYCILKTTKYPELSWSLLKALSGSEAQIRLADTGLTQPAIIPIAEGPHFAQSPEKPLNKKMLNEAGKYVMFEPFHTKWREVKELYIIPKLDLVFTGKMTAKDAIAKIAKPANELLKD